MSTKTGQTAEDLAAAYLESHGWEIIGRNIRTRHSEIDIIASSRGVIHFVEVKYRRTTAFGGGLDYITPEKIRRLRNAAIMWVSARSYDGDFQIDVITVEGSLANPQLALEQNIIEG
jgi:putative endonuclease